MLNIEEFIEDSVYDYQNIYQFKKDFPILLKNEMNLLTKENKIIFLNGLIKCIENKNKYHLSIDECKYELNCAYCKNAEIAIEYINSLLE